MNPLRAERRQQLVKFLRTLQKAGVPVESLGEEDRLVASGPIDSLAILQIIAWLETTHGIDFSVRGVWPEECGSIGGILDVIEEEKQRLQPQAP